VIEIFFLDKISLFFQSYIKVGNAIFEFRESALESRQQQFGIARKLSMTCGFSNGFVVDEIREKLN